MRAVRRGVVSSGHKYLPGAVNSTLVEYCTGDGHKQVHFHVTSKETLAALFMNWVCTF